MLSERKIKQLAEARKHIQHKPLSEEIRQKISKANNGNFYAFCDYCGQKFHTKKSAFAKRKHHFCCRECYSKYRAEIMLPEEQNAYGTGNDYAERLRRKKQEKFLIIICVTIIFKTLIKRGRGDGMTDGDRIFKFLQKCNRNHNVPDIHSFKAKINGGVVWVECRGYEVYIETQIFDEYTDVCKRSQWVGTIMAAANRLEQLGIDFDTIEM